MKFLVTNADDFGFTRGVNQGIIQAHREGILTATTLMATGAAFDHAVKLAREHPSLDIGVHLVLVGDPPFPATVAQLTRAVALGRVRIVEELRGQIQKMLDAGIRPSHLDTHKHTHLLPPVLNAVARLSEEFQIPWVRKPFDFAGAPTSNSLKKRLTTRAMATMRGQFTRVFNQHHCRATDHFAGFAITGRYDASTLVQLIRALPEGSTEFMCHPGILDDELRAAGTRLKESREQELLALTDPVVRAALEECGVRLASYPQLPIAGRPSA